MPSRPSSSFERHATAPDYSPDTHSPSAIGNNAENITMSKLITVFGATGTQGGSVVEALLQDKSLRIRGVTRNASSEAAKSLASKGVEVVTANLNDEDSLVKAVEVR